MGIKGSGKHSNGPAGAKRADERRRRGRSIEWKAAVFDSAAGLAGRLASAADYRISADILLETLSGIPGIGSQALYLDSDGSGVMRLIGTRRTASEDLPVSIAACSDFAGWLRGAGSPSVIDGFFRSAGGIADAEFEDQEALARAGLGAACPILWGGSLIGMFLFGSDGKGEASAEDTAPALGLMIGVASARFFEQLISDPHSERPGADEFTEARRGAVARTSEELLTSLGVLKSGLWSLDDEDSGSSVMIDMARDAALRLENGIRELISISGVEVSGRHDDLEEVDLADIVEDVTRALITEFERREIAVSMRDGSAGRKLRVEAEKLRFVFKCALEDCISRTRRGSEIVIEWRFEEKGPEGTEVGLGAPAEGPWIVLAVRGGDPEEGCSAIDAILDSIAGGGDPAGRPGSCMALARFIVETQGGMWTSRETPEPDISIWLPVGY